MSRLLRDLFPEANFDSPNPAMFAKVQKRLDNLTKPRGSLGRLEEIAARLFAIGGGKTPLAVDPALMITVGADHGVAARKVSPYPAAVTRQMALNFFNGGAAINALCATSGMDLKFVDAGCAGGPFKSDPMLLERRLGDGSGDISAGPAMSREVCVAGLRAGFNLASDAARDGYACVGCGELGIANTTVAAALFCAFLGMAPSETVGPGSGADAEMLAHKRRVVAEALQNNRGAVESKDPLAILAALGGFEIVELAGCMLGCAAASLPFLVDGYICAAAYVSALAFFPELPAYAFLAHSSAEPAFSEIMRRLKARPLLDLEMRLGEGAGAAAALPILRAACAIFNNMATFESARVSDREA